MGPSSCLAKESGRCGWGGTQHSNKYDSVLGLLVLPVCGGDAGGGCWQGHLISLGMLVGMQGWAEMGVTSLPVLLRAVPGEQGRSKAEIKNRLCSS